MTQEAPNFQPTGHELSQQPQGIGNRFKNFISNTALAILRPVGNGSLTDEEWSRRAQLLAQDGLVQQLAQEANRTKYLPRHRGRKMVPPSLEAQDQRNKVLDSLVERCRDIMTDPNPDRIASVPPLRRR